jgi:putative SOS response-associated peptidase YedK
LTHADKVTRKTDLLLEGPGFELSVPRKRDRFLKFAHQMAARKAYAQQSSAITATTGSSIVVRFDTKVGERSLDVMRWGLVPFWAKDIEAGFSNINAKAEGIEGKPAFREAFQRWRCLVPVDNFYEWKKTATGKQPYAIALADRAANESGRLCGTKGAVRPRQS